MGINYYKYGSFHRGTPVRWMVFVRKYPIEKMLEIEGYPHLWKPPNHGPCFSKRFGSPKWLCLWIFSEVKHLSEFGKIWYITKIKQHIRTSSADCFDPFNNTFQSWLAWFSSDETHGFHGGSNHCRRCWRSNGLWSWNVDWDRKKWHEVIRNAGTLG